MPCPRLAPISAGARVMIKTRRHDKPGITTHPAARRRSPDGRTAVVNLRNVLSQGLARQEGA